MFTDAKRLQQIIKNLLSNAFKFTHHGQVTLTVEPAHGGWSPDNEELNRAAEVLAFSVTDTGIGIPPDKQQIIFEAFQQADGSTSRKYGGTGLGLAISRELSRLLGGEIRLTSSARPRQHVHALPAADLHAAARAAPRACRRPSRPPASCRPQAPLRTRTNGADAARSPRRGRRCREATPTLVNEVGDDRDNIQPGDRVLLIVENDLGFARFLLDAAREQGLQGPGHVAGRAGAGAGPRVQARRHHARHPPARHRRLARAGAAEERPGDPAHPGVRHLDRRGARPGAGRRGAGLRRQADPEPRRARRRCSTTLSDFIARPTRSAAGRRAGRRRRSRDRRAASARDDVAGHGRGRRRRGAAGAARAARSTAWSSGPAPRRHDRRASCRTRSRRRRLGRPAGDRLRRRPSRDGRERLEAPGRGLHRAAGALAGAAARPDAPSSCTATSASCPSASGRCCCELHQSDKILRGRQKVLIVDDDMRNIFALSTRAGGARHGDRLGRQRPRRHPHPAATSRTSTSC